MNKMIRWLGFTGVVLVGLVLVGCAAGNARFTAEAPAGFWAGLWHGAISVVTLIVGLFDSNVRVYELHNAGRWYDFGFLLGAICVWGGGSGTFHHRHHQSRREAEWDAIGHKVERKLKRKIRQWAEAEPDEDWDVVEKKAEDKLKRKIREWAESDDDEPAAKPGGSGPV